MRVEAGCSTALNSPIYLPPLNDDNLRTGGSKWASPEKKKIAWINNEQNYSNSAHHNLPQHGGQWALRWQSWVNILYLNMILGSWVFCLTMLPLSLQNMGKPLSLEETWNPLAALVWTQARFGDRVCVQQSAFEVYVCEVSRRCSLGALRWKPGIIAVDNLQVIVQLKHLPLLCGSGLWCLVTARSH